MSTNFFLSKSYYVTFQRGRRNVFKNFKKVEKTTLKSCLILQTVARQLTLYDDAPKDEAIGELVEWVGLLKVLKYILPNWRLETRYGHQDTQVIQGNYVPSIPDGTEGDTNITNDPTAHDHNPHEPLCRGRQILLK